ncbi:MAG: YncE family protein [Deltaproteobacteria bacterium]|jgi:YVTN family beta-propeller protein|nr:YncE family protein [Deltaproteobacteria bacterium]
MRKIVFFSLIPFIVVLFATPIVRGENVEEFQLAKQVIEEKGLRIEFSIDPISHVPGESPTLIERNYADVKFRITDISTGQPVSPLEPAVWIDPLAKTVEIPECTERLKRYTQGTLSFQAAVDLNKFFILVMNNDQTISVIDPILGISGYSQLYAMIRLQAPAADWIFGHEQKKLYVTMPKAGRTAIVSMDDFKVIGTIESGEWPMQITMQPDGRYLWVGNDAEQDSESGVTVIDPLSNEQAAFIATGTGRHQIAFSEDSLFAYVMNAGSGTVSVIDTQSMGKIKDVDVGSSPASILYSNLARMLFVASPTKGDIMGIDPETLTIQSNLRTEAGLDSLYLAPNGRWLFAVNSRKGRVDIVDTTNTSLAHRLSVKARPFHVAFTDTYAYIRSQDSPDVKLLRLSDLGKNHSPKMQNVVVGNSSSPSDQDLVRANSIAPTGEWGTVVISNPNDKRIYYYMEGMIAPMGTFTTYGRTPMAVTVMDRSLRETEKGLYTARIRIPSKGEHSVAFLLDTPWVDNCFSFSAAPDPDLERERSKPKPKIVHLSQLRDYPVGQKMVLRFAVEWSRHVSTDATPKVVAMATRPPGNWQIRKVVNPSTEGIYELELTPEVPGIYLINFSIPDIGVDFTEIPYLVFKAVSQESLTQKERRYALSN